MKKIFKILPIFFVFALMSCFSAVALDESNALCTYTDTATDLAFTNMLNGTAQSITAFGSDEGLGGEKPRRH